MSNVTRNSLPEEECGITPGEQVNTMENRQTLWKTCKHYGEQANTMENM
jgi:hypothetical protein